MKEEQIKQLEEEVKQNLNEFSKNAEEGFETRRKILNSKTADQINLYSQSIKNLGLISGTVAPFSLALLSVDKWAINPIFLVSGFAVLMTNIVLAHIFLYTETESKFKKVISAELEWVFATSSKFTVASEKVDTNLRINQMVEHIKSIEKMDGLLGINTFNIDTTNTNIKLRKYNLFVNTLFALGCALIIIATLYDPVVTKVGPIISTLISNLKIHRLL